MMATQLPYVLTPIPDAPPQSPSNPLTPARDGFIIPTRTRVLLMAVREAVIMTLGALDDYLDMPRSVLSADERREYRWLKEKAQKVARGEV